MNKGFIPILVTLLASVVLTGGMVVNYLTNKKLDLKIQGIQEKQTQFYEDTRKLIDDYVKVSLGVATQPYAGMTYTLAGSGVSSSASSITLSSLTIPQSGQKIIDSDLSDTFYITLEPGNTTRQEIASCTTVTQNAAGSATLSGCSRGLSPITPYTASTTLQFAHGGGTAVIFSDAPQLFNEYVSKGNTEAITGLHTYNSVLPTSSLVASSSLQFVTKALLDSTTAAGVATSTESNFGGVWLSTQLQMASSTNGLPDKPYVLQSRYATSTPSGTSYTGLFTPISQNNGKLHQLWLDLTEAFTWAGTHIFNGLATFNATTTLATTTSTTLGIATTTPSINYGLNVGGDGYLTGGLGIGKATTTDGVLETSGNIYLGGTLENVGFYSTTSAAVAGPTSVWDTATASVDCNAGGYIISGGATTTQADLVIYRTYPADSNTWTVRVSCVNGAGCAAGSFQTYAICGKIKW